MIWNRAWTEEHKVVERFMEAMKEEIDSNLLKGDREQWAQVSISELMDEIVHHKNKLAKALEILDFAKIREHTADIANIAMMIADNTGVLGNDSPRFAMREKQREAEEKQKEERSDSNQPWYGYRGEESFQNS